MESQLGRDPGCPARPGPHSRVACETLLITGSAIVAGEITTAAYVEIPEIVRRTIEAAGYTRAKYGLDYLELRRPLYKQTAAYGHFGRTELDVAWEATDMAETLRKEV
jgi:S-adenosylmethionine synthetase